MPNGNMNDYSRYDDYVSPSMYAYSKCAEEAQHRTQDKNINDRKAPEIKVVPDTEKRDRGSNGITMSQTMRCILLFMLIGALFVSVVWMGARVSNINYDVNEFKASNEALQNEIEDINIKIESAASTSSVEERAMSDLNMVYPSNTQKVYVSAHSRDSVGLADRIREKAYGVDEDESSGES